MPGPDETQMIEQDAARREQTLRLSPAPPRLRTEVHRHTGRENTPPFARMGYLKRLHRCECGNSYEWPGLLDAGRASRRLLGRGGPSRGRRHPREAAAPEPVIGRWNLRGRAGNCRGERHEGRVRVLCPALHAHVACLRCIRRWADRLTCSRVGMSERRAGQRTNGQTRCRSHREESLPHRLAPFVNDTYIRLRTASGAF
jgi:hypothetical protein